MFNWWGGNKVFLFWCLCSVLLTQIYPFGEMEILFGRAGIKNFCLLLSAMLYCSKDILTPDTTVWWVGNKEFLLCCCLLCYYSKNMLTQNLTVWWNFAMLLLC